MSKKYPKGLLTALLAVTILTMTGGTAYLSMASSQYLASLFNSNTTTSTDKSSTTTTTTTTTTKPAIPTVKPLAEQTTAAPHDQDTSSNFVKFSLYGDPKPSTKDELCAFLDSRLHDLKILAPKALHRYTTDFSLLCGPDSLRPVAPVPEIDWSKFPPNLKIQNGNASMKSILRNATSGLEAILRTNNIFILFGDHSLPATTTSASGTAT